MTREQMKAVVLELLEKSYAGMTARVDKAIGSGAVNYSDEPPENYRIAKAVVTALLLDAADNRRPLDERKKWSREINNIRACMPS